MAEEIDSQTPTSSPTGLPASAGSPIREVVDCWRAMADLTGARKLMDKKMRKMIEALTDDPKGFPKAVKIGAVQTDVATIRIDGVTSKPLEILTGADGSFDIYADSYDEHGVPGRIIIELHRPVISENVQAVPAAAGSSESNPTPCPPLGTSA